MRLAHASADERPAAGMHASAARGAGSVGTLAPGVLHASPGSAAAGTPLSSAALRRANTHLVHGQRSLLRGGLRRDQVRPVLLIHDCFGRDVAHRLR